MLFGFFLFLSLVSFLFTWKTDQSQIGNPDYFLDNPEATKNWMRAIGCTIILFLYAQGIWPGRFCLPLFVFRFWCQTLTTKAKGIHWYNNVKYSILILVWFSLFLGLISHSTNPGPWQGGGTWLRGYYLFVWFKAMIGWVGVVLYSIIQHAGNNDLGV